MKGAVSALIKELEDSCRQPLFVGIGSHNRSDAKEIVTFSSESASQGYPESETGSVDCVPRLTPSKRSFSDQNARTRTWDTILADTVPLLPFMTDEEHGRVLRIAGILFLGFLLPQSTGNEFFLLENVSSKRKTKSLRNAYKSVIQAAEYVQEKEDMGDYIIQMPLEERLESCPRRHHSDEFGEFDTIAFEPLEKAFQSFLHRGLAPLLSRRPVHPTEVDLLHIIAMAIHPQPSEQTIPQTSKALNESENISGSWDKSKRLMSNLTPHSFHVNYCHRLRLVQLVTDCLVVPPYNPARASLESPLFEGALPHLRASLYAFGFAAIRPMDAHMAQCGMVALAIQSGFDYVVREEWGRLIRKMVDDRMSYSTCPCCCGSRPVISEISQSVDSTNTVPNLFNAALSLMIETQNNRFCPHQARGSLLQAFLTRYSEARYFADEGFVQFALSSLAVAIERQFSTWSTKEEDADKDGNNNQDIEDEEMRDEMKEESNQPTCVLVSLLCVAKSLFFLVLPTKTEKKNPEKSETEDDEDVSGEKDIMISCAIQLIHHWDPSIVSAACSMIVTAFSYAEETLSDYVGTVFTSVKFAVEYVGNTNDVCDDTLASPIEGLVGVFSQRSLTFAYNMMQLLLREAETRSNTTSLFRLVAAVARACPSVAERHRNVLVNRLKHGKHTDMALHIVASLLACRKATYFANANNSEKTLLAILSQSVLGDWQKYQIARQGLVSSNFSFATDVYHQLATSANSERTFLWLSALERVSTGEAKLSNESAKALPESITDLRNAISTFRLLASLAQIDGKIGLCCVFQIRFLELRVSFLELVISTRQLAREMRLSDVGPQKYTRPHLHLRNIVRQFYNLGHEYSQFCKSHGLFICQQSRSVLRTLITLCQFFGDTVKLVFLESLGESSSEKKLRTTVLTSSSTGDSSQPLTLLMRQLESYALQTMDPFVECKIRATILLEIIDGIFKSPFPVPKAFLLPKALPRATLEISWNVRGDGQRETKQARADGSFSLLAKGHFPQVLLSKADIPFSVVLLWYTVTGVDKSLRKGNKNSGEPKDARSSAGRKQHEVAASLSSSGSFFMRIESTRLIQEGTYDIRFRFGCRDIRGGEWEIPLFTTIPKFLVEFRRSV